MIYKSIMHQTSNATSGLSEELDAIMNEQLLKAWQIKLIVQVRANYFLLVFEK